VTGAGFCTDAVCVVLRTGVTNDCTLSGILVSSLCPGRCVSCTGGGGGDGGGGHCFFGRGGGHGFCTFEESSTFDRKTPEVS